jgi:hypothetical protein
MVTVMAFRNAIFFSSMLLAACLVGCRSPVQFGEFVVLGQSVSVEDGGESIKYVVLGKGKSDAAQKPLLVINFFPTFDGPYGFSHEGTHAGASSADRIDISGDGVDTSVLIQWDREKQGNANRTVAINGKPFAFQIGDPREISVASDGKVSARAE